MYIGAADGTDMKSKRIRARILFSNSLCDYLDHQPPTSNNNAACQIKSGIRFGIQFNSSLFQTHKESIAVKNKNKKTQEREGIWYTF